jgi:hypothetical protein
MTTLADRMEHWSRAALAQDWIGAWREGAIFPCEMVFFLARCDEDGVQVVVESGRQDGISTAILGAWAARGGGRVHSVDLEEDAARAAACRARLAHLPLDLVRGNAFVEVPRLVHAARAPTALLIDGPKGWPALAVAYGLASVRSLQLVSLHNLTPGGSWRAQFQALAGPGAFYEQSAGGGEAWRTLRAAEAERLLGSARSLEESSLGVMAVGRAGRGRLVRRAGLAFGLSQPPLLAAGWSLGAFGVTRYLFSISARLPLDPGS